MNKRAITIGALAVAMVTVTAVGSSLAYFTDKEEVTNTFTVGDVDIDLTEPEWNPEEEHLIFPGAEIKKNPIVTNIGINDAYVRVKVTISNYSVMKAIIPTFKEATENEIIVGFDTDLWDISDEVVIPETDELAVTLMYKDILKSEDGQNTVQVFSGLNIPTTIDDELKPLVEAGINPTISVVAEAIQSDNFEDVQYAFNAYNEQIG